jgi:hypothetical protein
MSQAWLLFFATCESTLLAPLFLYNCHSEKISHFIGIIFVWNLALLQKNWKFFWQTQWIFFQFFFSKFTKSLKHPDSIHGFQVGRKIYKEIIFFLSYFVNSQLRSNQLMDDHHLSYVTKLKEKILHPNIPRVNGNIIYATSTRNSMRSRKWLQRQGVKHPLTSSVWQHFSAQTPPPELPHGTSGPTSYHHRQNIWIVLRKLYVIHHWLHLLKILHSQFLHSQKMHTHDQILKID